MKIGLGLYRHQLNREHYDFARQCGATHLVVHLVDYFQQGRHNPGDNQPTGGSAGWGRAGDADRLWTVEELASLKRNINAAGLELEAVENLDPAHWHDVLLDGPKKAEQLENVKTILRRLGQVGIPVMGYNFSIAGVAGRVIGRFARGNALSVGMDGADDAPIPQGMVWNMVYDPGAPPGVLPEISDDELWRRVEGFLKAVLPVAEEAGVTLAAHPDDPPVSRLRRQPRLVYQPRMYQRLIDIDPRPANRLEFCIGTLAEMTEGDLYDAVEQYSRQRRIAYVHLRNIAGKAPHYRETFIDDGDVDIVRVLSILHRNGFDGVVIPDHAPQMTCSAPWHAGMAHALGFIGAALKSIS
ncbi:MAG: mannonate dehydratase [Sedimentisphaerales bacterium]|nr:mannonate dehydratase [Sedimentisphaerales bacterium]